MASIANVPGNETSGYDVLNLHMHGFEVAPHLFHPMGTSDPAAPWISLEPDEGSEQQCYCYRFTVSEEMSKGIFLYHTHRHGTTSMLTWSGLFGVALTDTTVAEGRSEVLEGQKNAANNPETSMI